MLMERENLFSFSFIIQRNTKCHPYEFKRLAFKIIFPVIALPVTQLESAHDYTCAPNVCLHMHTVGAVSVHACRLKNLREREGKYP